MWLYVSGDRPILEKENKETDFAYAIRIEDWESTNHQTITWFRNTYIPSIVDEFGNIDIVKEVRDLLVTLWWTEWCLQLQARTQTLSDSSGNK